MSGSTQPEIALPPARLAGLLEGLQLLLRLGAGEAELLDALALLVAERLLSLVERAGGVDAAAQRHVAGQQVERVAAGILARKHRLHRFKISEPAPPQPRLLRRGRSVERLGRCDVE